MVLPGVTFKQDVEYGSCLYAVYQKSYGGWVSSKTGSICMFGRLPKEMMIKAVLASASYTGLPCVRFPPTPFWLFTLDPPFMNRIKSALLMSSIRGGRNLPNLSFSLPHLPHHCTNYTHSIHSGKLGYSVVSDTHPHLSSSKQQKLCFAHATGPSWVGWRFWSIFFSLGFQAERWALEAHQILWQRKARTWWVRY